MRLGSLCTGYGGLDMAVQAVIPAELDWVADPDPGATKLLAHHHPDVPNLGDITTTDWARVEPVDILTAGFPCQDISNAGGRAGIGGDRSALFFTVVEAVRVLRPGLVYLENVSALTVRGLDRVAAELAAIGYVGSWRCVRASDVGAPHRRERVFIAAWPADPEGAGLTGPRVPGPAAERDRGPATHPAGPGFQGHPLGRVQHVVAAPDGEPAAHPEGDGWHEGRPEPARELGGSDVAVSGGAAWGPYAGAIARWERVSGRVAPAATEPGRTGPRLSPAFVEWLMGLDEGHITAVPGLSRNQQLKLAGNGVVPQQGAAALRLLLDRAARVAA